jgi:hypothetical protein
MTISKGSGLADRIYTTASGSSTALLLLRAEALQTRPNLQVYRHKMTKTRLYKVYYYYNNNKGIKDERAFPVCLYCIDTEAHQENYKILKISWTHLKRLKHP